MPEVLVVLLWLATSPTTGNIKYVALTVPPGTSCQEMEKAERAQAFAAFGDEISHLETFCVVPGADA